MVKIYRDKPSDNVEPVTTVEIAPAPLATWEAAKENIQPLSQGRKIDPLTETLPLVDSNKTRHDFLVNRKKQFDKDLSENSDNESDQLDIWCEYIGWLEQHLPDGGKLNEIADVIEECIEKFHKKKEFKQDMRLFGLFMKFRRFCNEPIEIFGFMYANSICNLIAKFYINWSWHYEMKKNLKKAEDLIKIGLKNLATPRELLLEAQLQLKCRIERMIRAGELGEVTSWQPGTSNNAGREFQSLKVRAKVPSKRIGSVVDKNIGGLKSLQTRKTKVNKPLEIYSDGTEPQTNDTTHLTIPTSQSMKTVGRSGAENCGPRTFAIPARPKESRFP